MENLIQLPVLLKKWHPHNNFCQDVYQKQPAGQTFLEGKVRKNPGGLRSGQIIGKQHGTQQPQLHRMHELVLGAGEGLKGTVVKVRGGSKAGNEKRQD